MRKLGNNAKVWIVKKKIGLFNWIFEGAIFCEFIVALSSQAREDIKSLQSGWIKARLKQEYLQSVS